MPNTKDIKKERGMLSKLIEQELAKDWAARHVIIVGAHKVAEEFVATLTNENVLKRLEKIKQKQLKRRKFIPKSPTQLKRTKLKPRRTL